MDIKVREVSAEEKSTQQIEQELLDKHEEKFESDETQSEQPPVVVEQTNASEEVKIDEDVAQEESPAEPLASKELDENEVLSYIGKRYGKEINSIDELVSKREDSEPLPEDVAAYLKYKKETGRGFEDYAKLQKDFSDLSPDALLKEYYSITEEGLDPEDIDDMLEEFKVDEDIHEPTDIKKIKLAKKKEIAKAKKFLRQQQEQYKQPLESRERSASVNNDELIEYRQYLESAKTQQDDANHKREWFVKKSDELFSPEFKGFKFNIGEEEIVYTPGSASELKKAQESPLNFINKYMDSNGFIKDASGYHRSLAMAMNPDKFAQFFYEQGKASATEDVTRKMKNIDMSTRNAPEVSTKGGMQIRAINPDSGKGLKIRSIKKK